MDVLSQIDGLGWIKLGLSIVFFLGPGIATVELLTSRYRLDLTQLTTIGLAMSIALTGVLFGALSITPLRVNTWIISTILSLSWATFIYVYRRRRLLTRAFGKGQQPARSTWLLWSIVATTALVNIAALAGSIVQPGSDGFHHTLISEAIASQGRLPENLLPTTTIATFTYHFAYHAVVAVFHWMTGIPIVALVPLVAQLLKALAALSIGLLVEVFTRNRESATIGAGIAGLVCVFPAYYVNWGRNTQLTGLVLMTVLFAMIWLWMWKTPDSRMVIAIAIMASGMALSHYRVTLMALVGSVSLVAYIAIAQGERRFSNRTRIYQTILGLMFSALLVAPWLWRIAQQGDIGFSASVPTPDVGFYRIDRIGAIVLGYPTNQILLGLSLISLLVGIFHRQIGTISIALWYAVLIVLATPSIGGESLDTISVLVSSFIPVSVLIGIAVTYLLKFRVGHVQVGRWLTVFLSLPLFLWGAYLIVHIVEPMAPYVFSEDLAAMRWIRDNTPEDARFMVNTFRFDYSPDYVIGSDAGFWLPVLADRSAVTAPMNYDRERNIDPDYPKRLRDLAELGSDLTVPEAVRLLRAEGIDYIYIGKRGGGINPLLLQQSANYELDFNMDNVYIFRLIPEAGLENVQQP